MATNIIEIRNSLMGGGGGTSSQDMSTGGGGSSATKGKDNRSMWKKYVSDSRVNKLQKGFMKKLGITVTLAAILKQSQIFTSMFGTLFQIFGAVVDIVLSPLAKHLAPLLATFATIAIDKAQKTAAKLEAFLEWLLADGNSLVQWFKDIWTVSSTIYGIIRNPLKAMDLVIDGSSSKVEKMLIDAARKAFSYSWTDLKNDSIDAWNSMVSFFKNIGTDIKGWWDTIKEWAAPIKEFPKEIGKTVTGWIDSAKAWGEPIIEGVKTKIQTQIDRVKEWATPIVSFVNNITATIQGWWDKVQLWGKPLISIVEDIHTKATGWIDTVKSWGTPIITFANTIKTTMQGWVTNIEGKIDTVLEFPKKIKDKITEVWTELKTMLEPIVEWIRNLLGIKDEIKEQVGKARDKVVETGTNIWNDMKGYVGMDTDSTEITKPFADTNEDLYNSWQVKEILKEQKKIANQNLITMPGGWQKTVVPSTAQVPHSTGKMTWQRDYREDYISAAETIASETARAVSENMYKNQMDFTDQQLREHAKTDFDSMLAYKQNSPRGYGSGNNAM